MKDGNKEIDMVMSEAPSMTALGQIQIDRTFVRVPDADNLFLIYNKYQEEWHLQVNRESKNLRDERPVFVIPEGDIVVHSRCLIVRRDDSGNIVNLEKGDVEKVKKYMVGMNAKKNKA